ncbi:Hypothetical protein FKW44_004602 [Caligus rogercresseyi]|uniref:Uncharacterized protein n=1 Tax=Caligus rogercresseyi TaxID=217165 RepID=A0A7T8HLW9_CALRO|nr:Hypothetical protein FKW44_004602 [Caligus rogercresseyi]
MKDLGVTYVRRRQFLTDARKKSRVVKDKLLVNQMKKNGTTVRVFSDKKLWIVDQ